MLMSVGAVTASASSVTTALGSSTLSAKPAQTRLKKAYDSDYNSITIRWSKVTNATGYRVYRYYKGQWVRKATIRNASTTKYTDTKLKSGTVYQYKVRAYKKKSNGEAVFGQSSVVKTTATKPSKVTVTSAPSNTSAIRLNWNAVKCDGYQIFQKQSDGSYVKIATIRDSKTTTYKVKGLNDGTKYTFKIRSFLKNVAGENLHSASVTVTKKTKEVEQPKKSMIKSIEANGTTVNLSWEKVDCDGYDIYVSGAMESVTENAPLAFYKKSVDIKNSNTTKATVSNLCSGTTYMFSIHPYNLKADGTKIYDFYIKTNYFAKSITTDYDDDEASLDTPTWATVKKKVKVKVNYEESYKCLELVNKERVAAGAEPLVMDKDLLEKAITRCAEDTYVLSADHVRANGLSCFSIGIGSENGCGTFAGDDAYWAVELWKGHLPHYNNMIYSNWKSTGIAIIEYNGGFGDFFWAVQVFSTDEAKTVATQPSYKTKTVTKTIEMKKYIWTY